MTSAADTLCRRFGATGLWYRFASLNNVFTVVNEIDRTSVFDYMLSLSPVILARLNTAATNEGTAGTLGQILTQVGTRTNQNMIFEPSGTLTGSKFAAASCVHGATTWTTPTINSTNPITIMGFVRVEPTNVGARQVIGGIYPTSTSATHVELYMTYASGVWRPGLQWGTPATPVGQVNDTTVGTLSGDSYRGALHLGQFSSPLYFHIAGVITGTNAKLYINGQLQSTLTATVNQTMGTRTIVIGARRVGSTVNNASQALISHFAIYGSALSDQQIARIARLGLRSADCQYSLAGQSSIIRARDYSDASAVGVNVTTNNQVTRHPITEYGLFGYEIRRKGSTGFTVLMDVLNVDITSMTTGQNHTLFDMMSDKNNAGGVSYSSGQIFLKKNSSTSLTLEVGWGSSGNGTPTAATFITTNTGIEFRGGYVTVVFGENTTSDNCTKIYVDGKLKYTHPVQTLSNRGFGVADVKTPSWNEPFGLSHTETGPGSGYSRIRARTGPYMFFPSPLTSNQVRQMYLAAKHRNAYRGRNSLTSPRRMVQYHGGSRTS